MQVLLYYIFVKFSFHFTHVLPTSPADFMIWRFLKSLLYLYTFVSIALFWSYSYMEYFKFYNVFYFSHLGRTSVLCKDYLYPIFFPHDKFLSFPKKLQIIYSYPLSVFLGLLQVLHTHNKKKITEPCHFSLSLCLIILSLFLSFPISYLIKIF